VSGVADALTRGRDVEIALSDGGREEMEVLSKLDTLPSAQPVMNLSHEVLSELACFGEGYAFSRCKMSGKVAIKCRYTHGRGLL
jgi:hypothetical protein